MSNLSHASLYGYQVEQELGHNCVGGRVTYLATNTTTQQPVVIKQFQLAVRQYSKGRSETVEYLQQQPNESQAQAQALYNEGIALFQTGQLQAALSKYEAALQLFRTLGWRSWEGGTLSRIGDVYHWLGQYEQALESYQQALAIHREISDRAWERTTLSSLGGVYRNRGQYSQALEFYKQALVIEQEIGDQAWKGSHLHNIGVTCNHLEQYEQALNSFEQALFIRKHLGDRAGEGETLNSMALTYDFQEQYEQALKYHQQALAIKQDMGDRQGEGAVLNNIAAVYNHVKQHQQALEYYQQALTIVREVGNQENEGNALNNIGLVYSHLGRYEQALDYLHQALAIKQNLGHRITEGITLGNIGAVYNSLGQYQQALDYYQQALAFHRDIGNRRQEGSILNQMGTVYHHLRQCKQALESYQQGLSIARETSDQGEEGAILHNIGYFSEIHGYTAQAITFYQQAFAVIESIQGNLKIEELKASYASEQVERYEHLIVLLWNEGQFEAVPFYVSSMDSTFSLAGVFEGNYRVHPNFIEVTITKANIYLRNNCPYTGRINLSSIKVGFGTETENGWTIKSSQSIPVGSVMKPGDTYTLTNACCLIPKESFRELSKHWLVFELEQVDLDAHQSIGYSYAHSERHIFQRYWKNSIEIEGSFYAVMQRLLETHQCSQGNLRNANLEQAFNYVERSRTRAFLDQFANGPINFRTGVSAKLLQQEETLKAQITTLRTQLTQLLTQERSLHNQISAIRSQLVELRSHPTDQLDTEAIATLQKQLLTVEKDYTNLLTELKLQSPEAASLVSVDVATLDEIQNLLDADTTLVEYFVTGDFLVAFLITRESFKTFAIGASREDLTKKIEAFRGFGLKNLKNPHPKSLQQLYEWLIAPLKPWLTTNKLAIVPHGVLHYLPFAALSTGARYLCDDYTIITLPSASILRFLPQKRKPSTGTLLALGNPTTTEPLPSLPFAEQEVNAIASLYGTQPLIGAAATESAVFSQAGNAEILHLSVHGEFNKHNPLFSTLHLAADEEHDGRLEVHDIYALDLTQATNLVVLSACQTQLGELSRGDEVVGLNRAFLYAGTPSVIATLWSVQDDTTALFMERFYTHLRSGIALAQALRQTQIEVRAEYPHPYYWAAFVLTGDGGSASFHLSSP
jgi:CHAT domain-containing protein/tetratricopeptide (TPR) repeat protein